MLKLATLGQLNRKDGTDEHITPLKRLKPDFEKKATYIISRFVLFYQVPFTLLKNH